jgi:hypothetical protein
MQYFYYALLAITLYFVSDFILLKIEKARDKPFGQQRSLMFLIIIMILAVSTFKIIELLVGS